MITNIHYYAYFFFNDTATTEIFTLSLHDALPISRVSGVPSAFANGKKCDNCKLDFPDIEGGWVAPEGTMGDVEATLEKMYRDRKSTRLNSSHLVISYAVFCLKKKNKIILQVTSR